MREYCECGHALESVYDENEEEGNVSHMVCTNCNAQYYND